MVIVVSEKIFLEYAEVAKAKVGSSHSDLDGVGSIPAIPKDPNAQNVP